MIFSEWVRRLAFWGRDFLTGSNVRKHFVDIKNIMENDTNPSTSKLREDYLFNILRYATENVEFYKKYKEFKLIKSFPVINKNIIRNHYEEFQSPEFLNAAVVSMHTSGSTGTPFVVRQDKNKRNRAYAEMIYFWGKAGYQVGMKYLFLRVWSSLNRKSRLTAWARNLVMVDIGREGEENLENIRNLLESDRKIRMIIAYGSTLETLANYFTRRDTFESYSNIKTIIGIGMAFPDYAQKKLKEVFNCNTVSLYSNQENGLMAAECIEHNEFHVNRASYYIELLKIDADEPVGIGEKGRIVVTDLFNHAMPLIRYDTGDIGVWKKESECGWHTQTLSSVQGRMNDLLFDTKGEKRSSGAIIINMWPFDKLLQYQFIQEGAKHYKFKLNGAKGHYDDATFVKIVKDALGEDAEVVIEHVNEIPVLESGKRKNIVNNYYKKKI